MIYILRIFDLNDNNYANCGRCDLQIESQGIVTNYEFDKDKYKNYTSNKEEYKNSKFWLIKSDLSLALDEIDPSNFKIIGYKPVLFNLVSNTDTESKRKVVDALNECEILKDENGIDVYPNYQSKFNGIPICELKISKI